MASTSIHLRPFLLATLFACHGAVGDQPHPPRAPVEPPPSVIPDPIPDPQPEPIVVPADLPTLVTTSTCTPLGPQESFAGVSPEGHLWLSTSSGATDLRVLDGWDAHYTAAYRLPIAGVTSLRAWTATTASVIGDGRLWHLADGAEIEIVAPGPIGADVSSCGDLSSRALLYSGGALYERIEDEWWQWSGLGAIGGGARLLDRDGECAGFGDGVWLAKAELEIWRLTPTAVSNPGVLEGATAPALRGDEIVALKDGVLEIGPLPWTEVHFAAGRAEQLAVAGAYTWVKAGDGLLRFDGHAWAKVDVALDGLVAIHPHASGGAWIERAGSICHVAPDPMLRVRGAHNGEQRKSSTVRVDAQGSEADMTIAATIDGVEVAADRAVDGWVSFSSELAVGWHRIALSAAGTDAKRVLDVKVVPTVTRSFASDVEPIYQTHCTGGACHVAGSTAGAPDLSTQAAWIARAQKVQRRIVELSDMPPPASRRPDWSADQVAIINEWLNGGMRP